MKIGLSTCGKAVDETFFNECKGAGISVVEISLRSEEYDVFDLKEAKRLADIYGIELWSYHLPFCPFSAIDISSLDEDLRRKSVIYLSSLILQAGSCGIEKFIVHPSAEPIEIENRIARLNQAKKSLWELADTAEAVNGVICVEDLPRTCLGRSSYDITELISDDDRLKVCFDTNHLLGEYIVDFIHKCGSKIVTTHVSDYDFWNERHWLPGEGKINWQELYHCLIEVGYNGPWLYEVGYAPERSIIRKRDLTAADFARNAKEIFDDKEITVLGTPVYPPKFNN